MELLIALTLLGVLMTAMLGGLRLGARVWESSVERIDHEGQVFAVRRFLLQRLEEALPIEDIGDGSRAPAFVGGTEGFRLASSMPASLGEGIFLMELGRIDRESAEASGDLVLRWRRWPIDPAVDGGERVILDDVAGIRIGYFGRRDRDAAPAWHERWRHQRDLPDLIRVDLAFAPNDRRRWPTLVVSPMVDAWHDTSF